VIIHLLLRLSLFITSISYLAILGLKPVLFSLLGQRNLISRHLPAIVDCFVEIPPESGIALIFSMAASPGLNLFPRLTTEPLIDGQVTVSSSLRRIQRLGAAIFPSLAHQYFEIASNGGACLTVT